MRASQVTEVFTACNDFEKFLTMFAARQQHHEPLHKPK